MTMSRTLAVLSCLGLFACSDKAKQGDDDVPDVFQCNDGADNDADGKIDFPDDPGCTAETDDSEDTVVAAQCADGRDNDGDGKMDFPNDPGCTSPNADDEMDDCPTGPNCPQCGNGVDDDGNGQTDYPDDAMGCSSASDPLEEVTDPMACGATLQIENLPADGTDTGTFAATSTSQISTPCGGGLGAFGNAYAINIAAPSIIVASTNHPGTTADTVVDIRSADCDAPTAEVMCNDDVNPDTSASEVTVSVPAGRYYIIVQGLDVNVVGDYELVVGVFAGEGSACVITDDCGPGLVCRTPVGQAAMVCSKPVCDDGIDDDGDTKMDYPADPGCASPTDDSETDDCPSGPNCPACSNLVDDDNDTMTDYPLDTSCVSASGMTESCNGELDPILSITAGTTTGTTVGSSNDHVTSCGSSSNTGGDILFTLSLPVAVSSLTLDTETSMGDTVLSLLAATCLEPSLDCDDDGGISSGASLLEFGATAAGNYVVAVDAYSSDAADHGAFSLHISGVLLAGASCEPAMTLNGALVCPATLPCDGPAGARTCQNPKCNNGMDDDGDLLVDFPNEPGCTSPNDIDETDACPSGAGCPMCSNDLDDDGDSAFDYPNDLNCASASGASEFPCGETDAIVALTMATTSGTLIGANNDHQYPAGCGSTSGGGVERTYTLTVPALTSLTVDTNNSATDVVLEILQASCTGPALDCDDESGTPAGAALATAANVPAGTYLVVVNAISTTSTLGPYDLHVSGVLPAGASCEPAATLGGAFTCPALSPCEGAAGSMICRVTQCSDGLDNNAADGIDYPNDPGCSDPFDNTETTTVTQCSNTTDDDLDTRTDYAADLSCWAASADNEAFCNAETDRVGLIIHPVTTSTTLGLHNDHPATTCQATSTANDQTFALILPVPVATLVISTDDSTVVGFDTVVSFRDTTCTMLLCDDDGGLGLRSQITTTNVAAGTYAIAVDGYDTRSGPFDLNVRGTVASGTACTSTLFATGVLSCPAGACAAGVCP